MHDGLVFHFVQLHTPGVLYISTPSLVLDFLFDSGHSLNYELDVLSATERQRSES